jgi:glycosyltransferase involved in cell wall biosynthesis
MASHYIDVLIQVFNGAATIRNAISSIQNQTFHNVTIVVVDDGSTDATPEILQGIAREDPRVQVVNQSNGGIVEARNSGLARCRAEYIAWLDADDIAAPNRLEVQLSYLSEHPDCVAVSGAVRHINDSGSFLGTVCRLHSPDSADPAWAPAIEPLLMQSFLMTRLSAVRAVGGYRHVLYAEDADFCWRMQSFGRLHNLETVVGDYRMHSASVSSRSIVNGRIAALSSQLAALSIMRRRTGRPDLCFTKDAAARYHAAESLANIFSLGCEGLSRNEVDQLEISLAGKLMELTSYRPYELELADCRFIRLAMQKHEGRLARANRATLARARSGTAARLAHEGRFREAAALISPIQYPSTAAHLAVRAVASPALRGRLRRVIGRDITVQLK